MSRSTVELNGQRVPADIVALATGDRGVDTAVVAFLAEDYVRKADQDTQIRPAPSAPPAPVDPAADTVIEPPLAREG